MIVDIGGGSAQLGWAIERSIRGSSPPPGSACGFRSSFLWGSRRVLPACQAPPHVKKPVGAAGRPQADEARHPMDPRDPFTPGPRDRVLEKAAALRADETDRGNPSDLQRKWTGRKETVEERPSFPASTFSLHSRAGRGGRLVILEERD